jgi:hypothetical protein
VTARGFGLTAINLLLGDDVLGSVRGHDQINFCASSLPFNICKQLPITNPLSCNLESFSPERKIDRGNIPMGDIPLQPGAPTESSRQNVSTASTIGSGPGFGTVNQPTYPLGQAASFEYRAGGYPPMIQSQYGNAPYTFASHMDMAQGLTAGRTGPYNMMAMANALPPPGNYRPVHHGQIQHMFNPTAGYPNMSGQVPMHLPQYHVPGSVAPMAHQQQYYIPQPTHAQMQQYYPVPVSPNRQSTNAAVRVNMGYYHNPVPTGQHAYGSGQYYYAQGVSYPSQGQNMHAQMMQANYAPSALQHMDLRLEQPQVGVPVKNKEFSPDEESSKHLCLCLLQLTATDHVKVSSDGRQNIVRGPPRKPKQSGEFVGFWLNWTLPLRYPAARSSRLPTFVV